MPSIDPVSTIVGGVIGGGQLLASVIAARKAKKLRPQNVDPQEAAYTANLRDLRNGARSGNMLAEALRQLRTQSADAAGVMNNAAGGYGGAAIEGVNRVLQTQGNSYGDIVLKNMDNARFYDNMYDKAINQNFARKADLQSNDYANMLDKAKSLRTAAFGNLGVPAAEALAGKIGDIGGGGGPNISTDSMNAMKLNLLQEVWKKKIQNEAVDGARSNPTYSDFT